MRARDYAQAFIELKQQTSLSEQELLKRFVTIVHQNGHRTLLPRIVRQIEKGVERAKREETILMTSAHEMTEAETATLLKQEPFRNILGAKHKKVERKVDKNIIGGHILKTSSRKVDTSYKQALTNLYQHITN
jgi:F0F1-type ATP synthase delta subunit